MAKKLIILIVLTFLSFSVHAQNVLQRAEKEVDFDAAMSMCVKDYEKSREYSPPDPIVSRWLSQDVACHIVPDVDIVWADGSHFKALDFYITVQWCYDSANPCATGGGGILQRYYYNVSSPSISGAQLGPPNCGLGVGNPINAAIGNKYEHVFDISDTRRLTLERHYNSYWGTAQDSLGKGWRHNFSTRILPSTPPVNVIDLLEDTGRRIRFVNTSGSWVSDVMNGGTLTPYQLPDGSAGWRHQSHRGETTRYFGTDGYLVQVNTRDSIQLLNYQTDGQNRKLLQSVVDDTGRTLTFAHDIQGHLNKVTNADGTTVEYGYITSGRADLLASVGYADNTGLKYTYDNDRLVGVRDFNDSPISVFGYDWYGRANLTQKAGGTNSYTLEYLMINDGTNQNWLTRIKLNGNLQNEIQLTAVKGLKLPTRYQNQGCGSTFARVNYQSNGLIEKTFDFNYNSIGYEYDAQGLEIKRVEGVESSKRTHETVWDASLRTPLERRTYNDTDALVAKSTWTYNARGQALTQTQTDPTTNATRTKTTVYCDQADIAAGTCPLSGLVTSIRGPRTDVSDLTTFTYYPSEDAACGSSPATCPHRKGDLWKVTNSLGHVTETLKYDGAGRVLSVKDSNGVITDMEYHTRGWLTARKVRGADPAVETDDQITRIDYWPAGLVKKVTQPDSSYTIFTYDNAHRLTDITDTAGNTIHYTLDNAGNKTQEDTKDAQGTLKRTLSRVYNQLGQLQTQKDASQNPTGFMYYPTGDIYSVTDALGRVTQNEYDPLNRLQWTFQDRGGINVPTTFAYDTLDNLTKITDPKGLDTNYVYNGLSELTQLNSPDTGITNYTYDSAGNRKTQVDARGKTSIYSYDPLNRLTAIAYPTTSLNVAYSYDANQTVCTNGETFAIGRLTKVTDSSGTAQYCYDRFGNLVRKVQVSNGKTFTLRYAYTLGGQLSSITYPNNLLVDYVRNGQGRVTQIGVKPSGGTRQVLLTSAAYAPFGPVTNWTYGNGRSMQRTLNQNYQPLTVLDAQAGGLSLGYEFDPVGNLSNLYNADQSTSLARYDYDRLSRLSDVKDGPTGTVLEHYGYDTTGNRLSVTAAGITTAYSYPAGDHRLSKVGTVARSYDAAGNTIQIGGTARQFVYNDAGRMSQVKAGTTVKMNYLYNGRGEQVRKYLGTANTYTLYDEAGRWLGDYDNSGAPVQQAIWLDDLPVGVMVGAATNQKLHYLEPDHLGKPRVVIDPVRNVAVWTWELKGEAFGNTVPNQDPDANGSAFVFNMRFPGQRYDAASGLNQNGYRDYEATTGRYPQSDPIGLAGGLNTYAYAMSNPIRFNDPNGLVAWEGTMAGGTFVTGGYYTFELRSKCVNGQRGTATVVLVGPGIGLGMEGSASNQKVKLEDSLNFVNPNIFSGDGFVGSADIFGPMPKPAEQLGRIIAGRTRIPENNGYGCSAIRLGEAGGKGCGGFQGAAFGAGMIYGSSTVVASKIESCSCEQ